MSPPLPPTGLAYVCEGLKEQRKGLVTLVLWNNQLTHHGMGYLAAALVRDGGHARSEWLAQSEWLSRSEWHSRSE